MPFDFPSSPAEGQLFKPGNLTYVYTGGVWKLSGGSGAPTTAVGDTPPMNPITGQLWYESDSGNTYIWFDDGNSQQWVQVAPGGIPPSKTAQTRNRIVNPSMQHSQQNGDTFSPQAGVVTFWPADQFYVGGVVTPGEISDGRHPSILTPTGGRTIAMFCNVAKGALAAGDYYIMGQTIEGSRLADLLWGYANAKPVVVQFLFWLVAGPTGKYSFRLCNPAGDRSYVHQFDIPSTGVWHKITAAIPGDTTGTWPKHDVLGMYLDIVFAAGTTHQTTAGAWVAGSKLSGPGQVSLMATAGGTILIGDVGLYLDPDATGVAPPFVVPDYAEELGACQRYWYKYNAAVIGYGYSVAGGNNHAFITFPVQMRATPTVSFSNITLANATGPTPYVTTPRGMGPYITAVASAQCSVSYDYITDARM